MLRFIGRENGEDYSTEFLIMLNTWEGAEKFLFSAENKKHQQIEIARFLGRSSRCQQPRGPKSRHGPSVARGEARTAGRASERRCGRGARSACRHEGRQLVQSLLAKPGRFSTLLAGPCQRRIIAGAL
jgi:hypothetical protein